MCKKKEVLKSYKRQGPGVSYLQLERGVSMMVRYHSHLCAFAPVKPFLRSIHSLDISVVLPPDSEPLLVPQNPSRVWGIMRNLVALAQNVIRCDLRRGHSPPKVCLVMPILEILTTEKRVGPSISCMRICFPLCPRSVCDVHCLFSRPSWPQLGDDFRTWAERSSQRASSLRMQAGLWAPRGASRDLTSWDEDGNVPSNCYVWLEVAEEGRIWCKTRNTSFYFGIKWKTMLLQ